MYLAALIMGIAGSLHCAGMCSPLAMAVTGLNRSALNNRLLYNAGRITTYGFIGATVATIGYLLPIAGMQNLLSIAIGSIMIVLAITGMTQIRIPFLTAGVIKFTNTIKSTFAKSLHRKNPGSLIFMGALNGLLPCGLTFVAASFCIAMTGPLEGFLYMLIFGIGTLPVMLGIGSLLQYLKNRLGWNIRKVTTGLIVISGLLLIARVFLVHIPEGHNHENLVEIVICR